MKRTTRQQDAAYLLSRLADATASWTVGDRCLSYNGRDYTTIVDITGAIVTLANGDAMHISKMRRGEA